MEMPDEIQTLLALAIREACRRGSVGHRGTPRSKAGASRGALLPETTET